ncbi:MAG TPA: TSUP family transporter [Bacteroidia bacterium]|jgi:siroheme synthase-like protein|nr:TSUP family transporter [Bacteroidia bacterium]
MQIQQQNKLFPVFLKLENFRVLIVGGGKIASEKISAILNNCPATQITLIAPRVSDEIYEWEKKFSNVRIIKRIFEENDLENVDFVIVAVNNKKTSLEIKQLAGQRKLITNVADTPEQCDFYLGSIVQKGDLKIAISTNGKSPTFAKRVKETLNDAIPNDVQLIVDKLHSVRGQIKDNFEHKVNKLNEISALLDKKEDRVKKRIISNKRILVYSITAPILIIAGYLLAVCLPPEALGGIASDLVNSVDSSILIFILAGFTAQMIDGALGMAYGVTATTFLLGAGVPPAASSASVHASEIFTSGVSGLMHLKFGNVNTKLFRTLLLPGILGAILGAYILSELEDYNYIIKPLVSAYTLILGFIIIFKALKKDKIREKIKRIFPLALVGGLMDSIGGGGWGPIVSSTLIAGGRHARFTIGSVNLAEFFVSLASSVTFFTLIGITHWSIIVGLIIGGIIAAPIAAWLSSRIPTKSIMILVGVVVVITSLKRIFF